MDLCTLADLKAWLGIVSDTDDELLARLISGVSAFMEQRTGRRFLEDEYREVRDGHGGRRLLFAHYPVTEVSSVKVDGAAILPAAGALDAGYRFTERMVTLTGYAFSRGLGNVELSYTAGYEAVPGDLAQACIELCALRYKDRERIGQVSKALGDGQTVAFSQKEMPDFVRAVLNNYRKVAPV